MSTRNTALSIQMWSGRSTCEWQPSGADREGSWEPKSAVKGRHSQGLGCLPNGRWSYHVSVALWALKLADRYGPGLLPGLLGEVPMRTRHSDKRTHAACSIQKCHIQRQLCRHCGVQKCTTLIDPRSKGARSCSVRCDPRAPIWQVWPPYWALHPTLAFTHRHACAHTHKP